MQIVKDAFRDHVLARVTGWDVDAKTRTSEAELGRHCIREIRRAVMMEALGHGYDYADYVIDVAAKRTSGNTVEFAVQYDGKTCVMAYRAD